MRKKYISQLRVIIVFLSLTLLTVPVINAFANTFLPNKTMELYKGETGQYCIYLQNTGEEDLTQIIKIFDGEEYIKNLDKIEKEFAIPAGTISDDLSVCMKVKLPRDAEKGEKYTVSYGVTSLSSEDKEGMVSFAPVQIREKFYLTEKLEKRDNNKPPLLPLGFALATIISILIIASYMYYRKIKNRKSKR